MLHSGAVFAYLVFLENIFSTSEKKGYTPKCRKTYNGVYDSAYEVGLTAEQPTDYIKFEKSDATPVKSTYNKQNKRNSVKHFFQLLNLNFEHYYD